jgi:GT2 family glycosyltransferase
MQTPTFTVVIPTHQRPRQLARCLRSLAKQTVSSTEYEVVVVDDAAMEAELEWVVSTAGPMACRLLSQAHLGAAAARNAGASIANGRFLAFTDDDCRPAPDWLESLEREVTSNQDAVLVGGRVVNELQRNPYASASQALVDFLYDRFNRDPQRARMLTSNNLCVPADAFREVGGFDTAFPGAGGEDRELCLRWAHTGHCLRYAPSAIVFHAHDLTLSRFVQQHFACGRGSAILRRRALSHGYGPLPLEPTSFYWELLRYPQCAPDLKRRWACSVLFAVSQVATGLGYLRVRLRESLRKPTPG